MRIDHPADIIMMLALSVAAVCIWASCARAEEPVMLGTQDTQTISEWILSNNPHCGEFEKVYTGYSQLLTDPQKGCKRYRTWKCKPAGDGGAYRVFGADGVDIEDLPRDFCN